MSFETTYPIYFKALALKRGRARPTEMLFVEHVDISVPVFDPSECPVAVSWNETRAHAPQRGESRFFDGAHHQRTTAPDIETSDDFSRYLKELLSERVHFTGRRLVDQQGVEVFDPSVYKLVDDRDRLNKLRFLRNMTGPITIVGSRLFLRSGEPSYYVASRNHKSPKNTGYPYGLKDLPRSGPTTASRYFSLNDFEGVQEFSPRALEKNGRYEVEVLMPETITADHRAYNLLCGCLEFRYMMERFCIREHDFYAPEGGNLDAKEGLYRLAKLLPLSEDRDISSSKVASVDFHALSAEVERLFPYVWVDCVGDNGPNASARQSLKSIEELIDAWRNRPLELDVSHSFG